jgi:hypothetical protein
MLGSNQRPPPCKGGATLFQGFLQSTNFLQTGAFSVVRFSRFFSIFARVAARLLHMRCSQSRHRRQPLIGVGGAEDLRLAAVWQPEVRELAVLVLEREPQATSTLSPSDVLFVGICTTHCQITVNLALTRVPGPGACGWTPGRAPPPLHYLRLGSREPCSLSATCRHVSATSSTSAFIPPSSTDLRALAE